MEREQAGCFVGWVNESIGEDAQRRGAAGPVSRKTSAGRQAVGLQQNNLLLTHSLSRSPSLSNSHMYERTLMHAHHATTLPAFHTASPCSMSTIGLLCFPSMHVNGGMGGFVFSFLKQKSFQLKLAPALDIIRLIC